MNIEKIKRELLEETNYRCGYCMKNITPRMYQTDNNAQSSKLDFDHTIYNVHDRAHIEPNSTVNDNFKDYYNLIALCKQCHWDIDKPKMLDIKGLKRQKLYWIIASGRFTKLEIDCLFQLYYSLKNHLTGKFYPSVVSRMLELDGSPLNEDVLGKKKNLYVIPIPRNLLILFHNIVKSKFVNIAPEIKHGMHISFTELGSSAFKNHELHITPQGVDFCSKFEDIFEDEYWE
jgi:hypothetical protein